MRTATIALTALLLAGCETTERQLPMGERSVRASEPEDRISREDRLVAKVEEDPEDARAWWELGEYYETTRMWPDAINAYSQLKGLSEQKGREMNPPRQFTAGDYHLGRVYAKARMFPQAVHHLGKVLELQPQDPSVASLNHHFREAHYLLGAIYFENRQWDLAKQQFITFEQLGGEPERVEPWLAEIEEATWTGHVRTRRTDRPTESDPPRGERPSTIEGNPPAQTPPAQTPPAQTPPSQPPAQNPPSPGPPAQNPPAEGPRPPS